MDNQANTQSLTDDREKSIVGVSRGLPARLEQVAGASEQWAGYGEKTLTMSHGDLAKLLREAAETITRLETELAALRQDQGGRPRGVIDGVLYCYGGCGRRYADFDLDVILPTPLWNRITVGHPFDSENWPGIEREGRGGVLCVNCMVARLSKLPGVTVAYLTTDMESV